MKKKRIKSKPMWNIYTNEEGLKVWQELGKLMLQWQIDNPDKSIWQHLGKEEDK